MAASFLSTDFDAKQKWTEGQGYEGNAVLRVTVREAQLEVVQARIDQGAECAARDHYGRTAWDYVQENDVLYETDAYW